MKPVRRLAMEPVPEDSLGPDDIDTGPRVAQVSVFDWRGWAWYWGQKTLIITAGLSLVAAFIGLQPPIHPVPVYGGLIATVLLLAIAWWLPRHTKERIRIGLDWRTNTLWVIRRDILEFLPHLNCITGLEVDRRIGDSYTHTRHLARGETVQIPQTPNSWKVTARYSSGELIGLSHLEFRSWRAAKRVTYDIGAMLNAEK